MSTKVLDVEKVEAEIEEATCLRRQVKRVIKKRGKMKVSGASVKRLAKIIGKNNQ